MRFPSQGVARHNAYDTCVAAERVERIGAGILRQAARGLAVKYQASPVAFPPFDRGPTLGG